MPARLEEVRHAEEEGIAFCTLTNPICINGIEGNVSSVTCQKMALGGIDESGRRSFIPIPNEVVTIDCDILIMAIGNYPNPIIKDTTKLFEFTSKALIVVDENQKTTCENVYAGGDIVTGAATVISAMGAGKKAAQSIYKALFNK